MDIHNNARLRLVTRAELVQVVVEQGFTLKWAAARFNVSEKTAGKRVRRFREEGKTGLGDPAGVGLCAHIPDFTTTNTAARPLAA